jgi:hypothetical protein
MSRRTTVWIVTADPQIGGGSAQTWATRQIAWSARVDALDLEGTVSKRIDSAYYPSVRSRAWHLELTRFPISPELVSQWLRWYNGVAMEATAHAITGVA